VIRALVLLGALGMGATLPLQAARTLANETFADGERHTFAPPASLAWRVADPGSVRLADGRMVLTAPARGVAAVATHFVSMEDVVELPVGGRLTMKLRLIPKGPIDASVNGIRLALLDTGGRRVHRDGPQPTLVASGYVTTINPGSGGVQIRKRTAESGPLIAALRADLYENLPTGGRVRSAALQDGVAIDLEWVIRRADATSNQVSFAVAQGGGAVARQMRADAQNAPARFDTLVIAVQSGVSAVEIERVEISTDF